MEIGKTIYSQAQQIEVVNVNKLKDDIKAFKEKNEDDELHLALKVSDIY